MSFEPAAKLAELSTYDAVKDCPPAAFRSTATSSSRSTVRLLAGSRCGAPVVVLLGGGAECPRRRGRDYRTQVHASRISTGTARRSAARWLATRSTRFLSALALHGRHPRYSRTLWARVRRANRPTVSLPPGGQPWGEAIDRRPRPFGFRLTRRASEVTALARPCIRPGSASSRIPTGDWTRTSSVANSLVKCLATRSTYKGI